MYILFGQIWNTIGMSEAVDLIRAVRKVRPSRMYTNVVVVWFQFFVIEISVKLNCEGVVNSSVSNILTALSDGYRRRSLNNKCKPVRPS